MKDMCLFFYFLVLLLFFVLLHSFSDFPNMHQQPDDSRPGRRGFYNSLQYIHGRALARAVHRYGMLNVQHCSED